MGFLNDLEARVGGRHNLLVIACLLPLLVIGIAYALGYRNSVLYFAVFLLCPLSHLLMMREHSGGGKNGGEEKKCH